MLSFTYQKSVAELPEASRFYLSDDMLLFDIETTGLSSSRNRVYLVGLGWLEEDQIIVRQYLTENASDEQALLETADRIAAGERFRTLVTFNGTTFDLPFFSKRFAIYDKNGSQDAFGQLQHLDLYRSIYPIRHLFPLKQFRQKNFEALLGIGREDQYDGGKLISVYHRFEKTKQADDLSLLCIHNKEDLFGMFHLISLLSFLQIKDGSYRIESLQATSANELSVRIRPQSPVPFSLRQFRQNGSLLLREAKGLIVLPLYQGAMRCYFRNPQDYYYLTAEETVVHKSVGQFVDPIYRRKATPEECYTSCQIKPEYLDGNIHPWEDNADFVNLGASVESFLQML